MRLLSEVEARSEGVLCRSCGRLKKPGGMGARQRLQQPDPGEQGSSVLARPLAHVKQNLCEHWNKCRVNRQVEW